jgi:hypothetical protein
MVRTDVDHPRFPNLPVVLFPGNVGDAQGLAIVYRRLNSQNPKKSSTKKLGLSS